MNLNIANEIEQKFGTHNTHCFLLSDEELKILDNALFYYELKQPEASGCRVLRDLKMRFLDKMKANGLAQ